MKCNFKDIIINYNTSNISNAELLNAIASLHPILDLAQEHYPKEFWNAMRAFHEKIKGPHFDKAYAEYQVSIMYNTKSDGSMCKGEVYTINDAKHIYENYIRNIDCSYTCWDVYVALNAQYHDYNRLYKEWHENISKEDLNNKIVKSTIVFWFKDEDAGKGKVWNYFKNIG